MPRSATWPWSTLLCGGGGGSPGCDVNLYEDVHK